MSGDAEIEPRAVATLALAVRRSNHSARSHPQTRVDLIHYSAISHTLEHHLIKIMHTCRKPQATPLPQLYCHFPPTNYAAQAKDSAVLYNDSPLFSTVAQLDPPETELYLG